MRAVTWSTRDGASRRRAGRVPAWIPLTVVFFGFVWLANSLGDSASARGVAHIDATRYRLHAGSHWVPDAWNARIERVLLQAGDVSAQDERAIRRLTDELAALSFVAEVGDPEVVWPDGLTVRLRLREAVACIRVGGDFLPVARDATVLAGYSYQPHEAYSAWLPVLGPHSLVEERVNPLAPGDVLEDPRLLDSLAVAISMWNHLSTEDLQPLGRIVIDASREFAPDGFPGGVMLDLEGARRFLFGRAPKPGFPGELPEHLKWANVRTGLGLLVDGEHWDLFDLRWDEPQALRLDEAMER